MGYYITKTGLSGKTVYWTGGVHWSDDISKKKTYVNKGPADSKIDGMDIFNQAQADHEFLENEKKNIKQISHKKVLDIIMNK